MQTLFEAAKQAGPLADPFTVCWQIWPRKDGKAYAAECYRKACRKAYPHIIEAAVRSFIQRHASTEKQFIPHLSTWLNRQRWLDEEEHTAEARVDRTQARLESNAKMIKRGLRLTTLGPTEARECLKAGLITEKEAKDYGA
jgi:hypothetical protein